MTKIIKCLKNNLKYILPAILIVIVIAGFFYYRAKQSNNSTTEFISFSNNYIFNIPQDYYLDADIVQGSTIIIPNKVGAFNPNYYKNILEEGGIVVQSFPSLNQNDDFFERYVKEKYKSNETANVDINFEEINKHKVATIKIDSKSDKVEVKNEFVKIVNLPYPVIIATSKPSEALNIIVKSIKNIDENKGSIGEIKRQIITLGTLLKYNMYSDIYSMFSQKLAEGITENDFKTIMKDSEKMIQRQFLLNGGTLNNKDNEFSCKIVFIDPENKADYRFGYINLKKENGKWLISKFELPKAESRSEPTGSATGNKVESGGEANSNSSAPSTPSTSTLPAGVSQEQINKALEKTK